LKLLSLSKVPSQQSPSYSSGLSQITQLLTIDSIISIYGGELVGLETGFEGDGFGLETGAGLGLETGAGVFANVGVEIVFFG